MSARQREDGRRLGAQSAGACQGHRRGCVCAMELLSERREEAGFQQRWDAATPCPSHGPGRMRTGPCGGVLGYFEIFVGPARDVKAEWGSRGLPRSHRGRPAGLGTGVGSWRGTLGRLVNLKGLLVWRCGSAVGNHVHGSMATKYG
jgi:hypothetical protein